MRGGMNRGISLAAGIAIALCTTTAAAQNQGFALDRFEPSETGSDWFALESLDFRGEVRPAFGLVPEWAYKPLVIYDADGNEVSPIVEHQVFLHVGASLVFIDRLRLGVSFPMALTTIGEGGIVDGVEYRASEGFAPGDLRIGLDARIVGEFGDPAVFGAGIQVHAPTGSQDGFAGDGKVRLAGRLLLSGDASYFTYALRVGVNGRFQDEDYGGNPFGTELTYGAAAGLRLVDGALVIGPEFYGSSVVSDGSDGISASTATPLELIVGGHYALDNGLRFGLGAGPGLSRGLGAPIVRAMASIEWSMPYEEEAPPPPPADTDGDGILDPDDACPTVKGLASDDPAKNGCPDTDGDGIIDKDDACPTEPGVPDPDPAKNGCPPPPPDTDGDGITDKDDACPTVPGVPDADPKKNGCPPDTDGDGIYDKDDACPTEPGPASEDPKKHGCPLPKDTDGDGIMDPEDACPTVKGDPNPDPTKNGCPKAVVVGKIIKIMERVEFDTAKATIRPESNGVLTAVLDILKTNPDIELVSIEGHTDNVGGRQYNKNLSRARAASVVNWLVGKGIDRKRLASDGFGDTKPIDTNDTPEGRQNNRRVEFHIVKQKEPAQP